MKTRPPALARWLLAAVTLEDDRPHLLADLDSEYEALASSAGGRAARRWYRSQCLRSLVPLVVRRIERRTRTSARRKEPIPVRHLFADVPLTLRGLRKRPAWAVAVVATLGLGLGAHQVVYTVVRSVVLRDFPYPEPDRIVRLSEIAADGNVPRGWTSIPNFLDWKREAGVFSSLALYRGRSMALTGYFEPEYLYGALVTEAFFDVFGTQPIVGRGLVAKDGAPGAPPVVVLGHRQWQSRFAGDRDVVGSRLTVDGVPRIVVGVMPDGFTAPAEAIGITSLRMDLWIPLETGDPGSRDNRSFQPVGRVSNGVSLDEARAAMRTLGESLAREYPESNEGFVTEVERWHEAVVSRARPVLFLLWATCAFALLIACANVAILWLNRALERRSETALRVALGAGRGRLARQSLTEGLVVAAMGGVVGLIIARLGLSVVTKLAPPDIPRLDQTSMDGNVWVLGLGLSLLAGFALSAVPLWAGREASIRQSGGILSSSRERNRTRAAILVAQVALCFTLCVAAGLTGRSLVGLLSVSSGLRPERVVTATVALSWDRVATLEARARWVSNVLERLRALPFAESAGMINSLPFSGSDQRMAFRIDGTIQRGAAREPVAAFRGISSDYFRTMGIPLLRGRDFQTDDLAEPSAAIVNETFARRYLQNVDPLEAAIVLSSDDGEQRLEIIGVAADVRHYGLDHEVRPEIYRPYTDERLTSKSFVVLSSAPVETMARALEDVLYQFDPEQPIRDMGPMADYVRRSLAPPRFAATVVGAITTVALTLAAIGLFGTMSSWVSERRGELGLRLALGADRRRVVRDVVSHGTAIAAVGIAAGVAGALFFGRAMTGLLFGVRPSDPAVFVAATLLLLAVSVGAAYFPARRAAKIDPADALRSL